MSDSGSRGRSPAPGSPRPGSPRPPTDSRSPSRGPAGQPGYPPPMGKDPARLEPERKAFDRVELPADAYALDRPDIFLARPKKLNESGQAANIEVNQYKVTSFDYSKTVHQYAVSVSPLPAKVGPVLKKLWYADAFVQKFPPNVHRMFLFDGRALAWSSTPIPGDELRVMVDLDEGKDVPRKGADQNNKFYITLRKTTEVNLSILDAYIKQKASLCNPVIEAMTFFDHLIRHNASQHLVAIKRNFYDPRQPGRPLMDGAVVEVRKGLYWSGRITSSPGSIGLAINADVTNTAFFVAQDFLQLVLGFMATQDRKLRGLNPVRLEQELRPVSTNRGYVQSEAFKQLKKLSKLKVRVNHPGRPAHLKTPIGIQSFSFDARFGGEGSNARNNRFEHDGKTMSVEEYFLHKYQVRLRFPGLPCIVTGKGNLIPMELAAIEPMQRYPFKLSPMQTSAMIKIAANRPRERRREIEAKFGELRCHEDPYLKHFGLQIEPRFTKTQGRLLSPPVVHFRNNATISPQYSGRWIVQGKKMIKANRAPLASWGFLVMENCVDKSSLQRFAGMFRQIFQEHGGNCTAEAILLAAPGNVAHNAAEALHWAFEQIKAKTGYPQIIFVVVAARGSDLYGRIKKSADVRFGVLSQVLNAGGVQASQKQFISNVCLKVNAKLGGATSVTMPPWAGARANATAPYFPPDRPTVIVGVDISHPAPGAPNASIAAMTMSVDPDANRYAAAVATNGRRTEMLTTENCHSLFGQLMQHWREGHPAKAFPRHVIYMRDGCSTGEFSKVLDMEVAQIKAWFGIHAKGMPVPKFTTMVLTKRHKIRLFPEKGDKNSNALPGTLVEKDVVHPRLFDFILNSHSAIQGTARPCHYHVLQDEMGVPATDLQRMVYEQSYSYARSTTPVSLHPAVYYAHLAGARARDHENLATSAGPQTGGKGHEAAQINLAKGASVSSQSADVPPLLPLGGNPAGQPADGELRQRAFIRGTMWYI